MGTVLVTGANGFIGRHVCSEAALAGHHVLGIGHGHWTEETWRRWGLAEWRELDVTLASLIAHAGTPDLVVHCAGASSVGASFEDPAQDLDRTVRTTAEVLEYVRTTTPRTPVVYPSSAAVYGRSATMPLSEDGLIAPISPYGFHKKMAEDLCRSYAHAFGIRIAIVRLFSAYGIELRKQLLWDACRKAIAGDRRFAGTGDETRDWVHAEDAARLLLLAGDRASATAPTVNGSSGTEVPIRTVLDIIFEVLGSVEGPEFTGTNRPGDPERYVGDPSRALAWGWTPRRQLSEGVREYVRWFREAAT